jgi:hypothetical protein
MKETYSTNTHETRGKWKEKVKIWKKKKLAPDFRERLVVPRGQNFGVLDRWVSNELSNFLQLDPFGVRIGTSYKKNIELSTRFNLECQFDKSTWTTLERVRICRFDGPSNVKLRNQLERLWNELEFVDLMDFRSSSWKVNLNDLRTSPKLTDFERPPNASFETFRSSTPKFWPLDTINKKIWIFYLHIKKILYEFQTFRYR